MFEGSCNLFHIFPDGCFLKGNFVSCILSYLSFEVTLFRPFTDNVKFIILNEGINILDNIEMVKGFHEFDFLQAFFPELLVRHVENLNEEKDTLIFLMAKGTLF